MSGTTQHLGVDIGATLAKLAIQGPRAGQAPDFEFMPSRELDSLVVRIQGLDPATIGLTGGGAARLSELIDRPSVRVDEFRAWGAGARWALDPEVFPADSRYLLVSLGTGTSILLVDAGNPVRVGGTALGGGTVLGLGAGLLSVSDFAELCDLAKNGDRRHVDLVVSDIYRPGEIALPDELTAASFGKLAGGVRAEDGADSPENLAAGIMGLVGENVGLICAGLSFATQVERIVFGGSTLRENPALAAILDAVTRSMGRQPHFLPHGEFGGALGALELARVAG